MKLRGWVEVKDQTTYAVTSFNLIEAQDGEFTKQDDTAILIFQHKKRDNTAFKGTEAERCYEKLKM